MEVNTMSAKRKVEIFSAGCPVCDETVQLVNSIARPSCEVSILDMNEPSIANRARGLGVKTVPAVAIDGKLADCCTSRGTDQTTLRAASVGEA